MGDAKDKALNDLLVNLPESVTVSRSVQYNIRPLVSDWFDMDEELPSYEDVMTLVVEYAHEDLLGPIRNLHSLEWKDEQGNKIDMTLIIEGMETNA